MITLRNLLIYTFLILLGSCNKSSEPIKSGTWRGVIKIQGQELPFNLQISQPDQLTYIISLVNGEEKIPIRDVVVHEDSVFIPMHIFDAVIEAKVTANKNKMTGVWRKNYTTDYVVPFEATYDKDYRFVPKNEKASFNVSGKWKVNFDDRPDSVFAIGTFEQDETELHGSILTPTGDYRFLVGNVYGDSLYLSTFDGEFAYLFKAKVNSNNQIKGDFWSGKSRHTTWSANRDSDVSLPDPEKLTYLKDGHNKIEFSFPDLTGNMVSPNDEKYKGKVLILQIFGTWCPNCMDETKFLADWYKRNSSKGVEILGLAYERKDDFSYAAKRVETMIQRMNVTYDFAIAGTPDKASESLPMLNKVMSFPTTIYIDKQGVVRKIHTGFSGPGTGKYYEDYVEEFNRFVEKLLSE